MNNITRKLLDKAVDAIESAVILLDHGKIDGASGRAYYALFYIAEALLNLRTSIQQTWQRNWSVRQGIFKNKFARSQVPSLAETGI